MEGRQMASTLPANRSSATYIFAVSAECFMQAISLPMASRKQHRNFPETAQIAHILQKSRLSVEYSSFALRHSFACPSMDPISVIGLTTSLIAICSSIFTVITLSRDWQRRTIFAKDVFDVHNSEIGVLQSVLEECSGTVQSVAANLDVPPSIYQAFENCAKREATLSETLKSVTTGRNTFFLQAVRLPLRQKELKRQYGMFKEDVLLLRALCTELRSQQQLVDMRAGILRLVSDYVPEIDDSNTVDGHIGNETASGQSLDLRNDGDVRVQIGEDTSRVNLSRSQKLSLPGRAVLNTLLQMSKSNYVVQATVAVETPYYKGGSRFKFVPAESAHIPALVKLDTGSDIDIVSEGFLEQAGVSKSLRKPIPAENAECFITIGGKEYQPESQICLFWYMEGEQRIRRNVFFVVSGAPVDLLLSSKNFAREAASRVALFSRAPKSAAMREIERRNEEQRREDAREEENKIIQEELRKIRARQPTNISAATPRQPDVELGAAVPHAGT
ncbi:hypothetical protein L207DRAFT_590651 [Hyaloscypha variabilis F]|uniref:Uncharacterized protein n=1 Tax=Hyaloscypha variabilis (strain UAMH 11265 / GT02V1 / F) TaxID=1149755 RepID=A0A2J6R1F9_HYAVF|nr:hypothetical protein L207DRAFT_590651 [Hyaloscypha variabilis F]